jgi:hypothetical protein
LDVLLAVAACSQALLESHHRGGQDQEDDRVGVRATDLLGALHLDLEQHVLVVGRRGYRGAVEVAVELGPFEEPVVIDGGLEVVALDEDVLRALLGRARGRVVQLRLSQRWSSDSTRR